MNAVELRDLIIEEIRRVPEPRLAELYALVRRFRPSPEPAATFDSPWHAPGDWDALADQIFNRPLIR
jgi:hypothetical protein